jgi:hypothetical protein
MGDSALYILSIAESSVVPIPPALVGTIASGIRQKLAPYLFRF